MKHLDLNYRVPDEDPPEPDPDQLPPKGND